VLHLVIGCDLPLQPSQNVGLIVDPAQHLQPDGSKHDQQADDHEEPDQQLGLNAHRPLGNPADEPVSELT
jgi:hypothetical protein